MRAEDLRFSYFFQAGGDATRLAGRVYGEAAPLLGESPALTWVPQTPEPWKLYARVTVSASGQVEGRAIAFTIERGLMTILGAGDGVHLSAVPTLGLSIVREGQLIAAAGAGAALASIPMGDVSIRLPAPAEVPLPFPLGMGPRRSAVYPVRPVEISIDGAIQTRTWWGRPTLGPFDVLIRRGRDGEPLLSFERKKVCPETAAHTSAELMDRQAPEIFGIGR